MSSIAVVGNINADVLVSPVVRLPDPGGDVLVDDIGFRTAGAAGNAALALHALGVAHQLVGVVGDDAFGRLMHAELTAKGLADDVELRVGTRSGASICLEAPGRERAFFTYHGVLAQFGYRDVPPSALRRDLVLLTGYFTLPGLRDGDAARLLGDVRSRGGRTLFDTGWCPDDWPASSVQEVLALLPDVDVFLPNDAEAAALTGDAEPQTAARRLAGVSGGVVVVKAGPRGAVAAASSGEIVRVPAPVVDVHDTTGAGDSFDAGFLLALARGADLADCVAAGVALASEVVARPSDDRYPRELPALAALRAARAATR